MKVTRNKSGTYTCQIMIYDSAGKRHSKRFTARTKREAQQAALDYQTEHTLYMESMAFCDCLQRFIDKKAIVLSPTTIKAYRSQQRTLTKEYERFCSLPIDRITQHELQALVNDLRLTRKAKTVRNFIGMISAVMTAEGYRIPSLDVKKDKRTFSPDVPDESAVRLVADAVKGTRLEAAFALACMGLRRGEICGVTPADLDGSVLHIHRTLVQDEHGLTVQKSTKTETSDRYIVIPDRIADLIRERGCAWDSSPNALTECFARFLESHSLPIFRLHDCRHFFASYCHDVLKLSDAQIMKLGGWSTPHVMKRVYITAITNEAESVQSAFSTMLKAAET